MAADATKLPEPPDDIPAGQPSLTQDSPRASAGEAIIKSTQADEYLSTALATIIDNGPPPTISLDSADAAPPPPPVPVAKAPSALGRKRKPLTEQMLNCRVCRKRFPSSEGVCKGSAASPCFTCHPCNAAVARVEGAYVADASLGKAGLKAAKKSKEAFRLEQLKARGSHMGRNKHQRTQCAALVSSTRSTKGLNIIEGVRLVDKKTVIKEKKWEQMNEQEAADLWLKQIDDPNQHTYMHKGKKCLVLPKCPEIDHERGLHIEANLNEQEVKCETEEQKKSAFRRVHQLAMTDSISHSSFSALGSHLLRPVGSVQAPGSADELASPLTLLPRGGEISLSQESAFEEPEQAGSSRGRPRSSAATSAASSASAGGGAATPGRSKAAAAKMLIKKQELLVQLGDKLKVLAKNAKKLKEGVFEHKDFEELDQKDRDVLDIPGQLKSVDDNTAAAQKASEALQAADTATISKAIADVQTSVATVQDTVDGIEASITAAKSYIKRLQTSRRSKKCKESREALTSCVDACKEFQNALPACAYGWLGQALLPNCPAGTAIHLAKGPSQGNVRWGNFMLAKQGTEFFKKLEAALGATVETGLQQVIKKAVTDMKESDTIGAAVRFKWSTDEKKADDSVDLGMGWWPLLQKLYGFPDSLKPMDVCEAGRPWLLAVAPKEAVSGPAHFPLLGLAGVMRVVKGRLFIMWGMSDLCGDVEGCLRAQLNDTTAPLLTRYIKDGDFGWEVLEPGETLYVPRCQTLAAVNINVGANKAEPALMLWLPLANMTDFEYDDVPALMQCVTGITANSEDPMWKGLQALVPQIGELADSLGSTGNGEDDDGN